MNQVNFLTVLWAPLDNLDCTLKNKEHQNQEKLQLVQVKAMRLK